MEKEDIKKFSLQELKALKADKKSETKADAAKYEVDSAFWNQAELKMPGHKKSVHLRMGGDVFEWFKSQGSGHLTRMNAVLRSYYEAHKATD